MSKPGEKVHAAIKRHRASVEASRATAAALAAERDERIGIAGDAAKGLESPVMPPAETKVQ